MSSSAPAAPLTARRGRREAGALRRLTITELKLFARERVGLIWGVGFPVVLLIIFGAIPGFRDPVSDATPHVTILDAYVPILIAFVLAMLAINVLPAVLAGYREKGILRRLATTPVGPQRVLAAQLIICVGMAAVTLVALLVLARSAYHVPLPRQIAGFVIAALLTTLALISIGLFYAAVAPTGRAANAMGAITFFPMMFFAGLWLPIAAMPALLQHISHATPLGAGVQALSDTWQGHWPHPMNLVTLAIYAVVLGAGAARLFRWE
ncbi:MAG TPA: ABC transporter permease [Streptosporangiaceae bacterium]|nr:ABC transporter permease [Streptosporangiaceae bacterium]